MTGPAREAGTPRGTSFLGHVLYFLLMGWSFLMLSRILPGFEVNGWGPAILGAIVLAVVNTVVRPVLFILTLPFTIVTLGLFLLVLNAIMLWITDLLVPGMRVSGFLTLLLASTLLALVSVVWKSLSRG